MSSVNRGCREVLRKHLCGRRVCLQSGEGDPCSPRTAEEPMRLNQFCRNVPPRRRAALVRGCVVTELGSRVPVLAGLCVWPWTCHLSGPQPSLLSKEVNHNRLSEGCRGQMAGNVPSKAVVLRMGLGLLLGPELCIASPCWGTIQSAWPPRDPGGALLEGALGCSSSGLLSSPLLRAVTVPFYKPFGCFPPELHPRHMFLSCSHKVGSGKNLRSRL